MGDYCAPARGTMEIMHPEGHIMPPLGCQRAAIDQRWRQQGGSIMQPKCGIMCSEGCIISIGPRAGVL